MMSKHSLSTLILAMALVLPHSGSTQQKNVPAPGKPAKTKTVLKVTKPVFLKPEVSAVATVTVKATPEVAGETFTLGEISEITGGDKALRTQLSALLIGGSPLPGMARLLFPGDISVKLRGAHLEGPRVVLVSPAELHITRAANNVAAEEITQAAITAVRTAYKELEKVTLEPVQAASRLTLPSGKMLLMTGGLRGKPEDPTIYVPITILVDGKLTRTLDFGLRVRRKIRVLVATRQIEANDVISKSDVQFREIETSPIYINPAQHRRDVVGKKARQRILFNTPLPLDALVTPPTIAANDRINVEYALGGIVITTSGVAQHSGSTGETIRVFLPDTKKEVTAVVINRRIARISDIEAEEKDDPANVTDEDETK